MNELGGVIHVKGPGKRRAIVHYGPEEGVCRVAPEGCGYCIGVPCRLPRAEILELLANQAERNQT
jgi:hypothetical protein